MATMNQHSKQEWRVSETEAGLRLDKWLAAPERLGSRSRALSAIERGKIFINEIEQGSSDAARKVQSGEIVQLWMDRPGSAQRRYSERRDSGLHLIYEDQSLLVVNKPAGILTVRLPAQPDEPSLLDRLERHLRSDANRHPLVVHRIDRDTSGLVLFAKTGDAQRKLKDQFERRQVERVYLAIVYGQPQPASGEWRDALAWDQTELRQQPARPSNQRAHTAICHYRVIEQFPAAALLEVRLATGKRNQIRIQAALHGHPLIGEKMYVGDSKPANLVKFGRQALHSYRLKFKHPKD
jgi:23S rRNA pseudouridine1911/1915/1917 synthase